MPGVRQHEVARSMRAKVCIGFERIKFNDMKKPIGWMVATFALLVSFSMNNYAQKISADEQRIVNYIDAHMNDAVSLLERSVNIESPTENLAGVRQAGAIFKVEFDALGFTTKWLEMPAEMKRAGHLLAEKSGTNGKRILLLGHLDTVLSGERFRREGDKAYGTGTSDMKSGDVVILYALKALSETGALKDASVIVILTGDEENTGRPNETRIAGMLAAAKRSDAALSFDGGDRNLAQPAMRGQSFWELRVTAKTGHSSQIFKEGAGSGAIFEAARILNQFYESLHNEKYLSFNAGAVAGGSEIEDDGKITTTVKGRGSVIPSKAVAYGDLRFISKEQEAAAHTKMKEIVARSLPGAMAEITFYDGLPAMPPTEGNNALLTQLDAVSRDLNFGKVEAAEPLGGATDISEIAHLLPCLEDMGGIGAGDHARGEYVELDTLPIQIKRAALLIYRLTR
jgi:glutamate carboxypeptidase